jgi:hypothetical protein
MSSIERRISLRLAMGGRLEKEEGMTGAEELECGLAEACRGLLCGEAAEMEEVGEVAALSADRGSSASSTCDSASTRSCTSSSACSERTLLPHAESSLHAGISMRTRGSSARIVGARAVLYLRQGVSLCRH